MALHGGVFPATAVVLQTLPGIGRSTAGAIAAFCFSERVPILDANVRRVLTRFIGFGADLAVAANERAFLAVRHRFAASQPSAAVYAAIHARLDGFGAMVCLARKPLCARSVQCSRSKCCGQGVPENYPVKTRKLTRQSQAWCCCYCAMLPGGCIWSDAPPLESGRACIACQCMPHARMYLSRPP